MKEFIDSEVYKKIVKAIRESFQLEITEVKLETDEKITSVFASVKEKGLQVWDLRFSKFGSQITFEINVFWNPKLDLADTYVPGSFSIPSEKNKSFDFDRFIKFVHKDLTEEEALKKFKITKEISADQYLQICFDLYKKYYDPFIKDVIEGRSWPQKLFPSIQDDYS